MASGGGARNRGGENTASFSPPGTSNLSNLDRFLEQTTPVVPARFFNKISIGKWRTSEDEFHPYFILGDLWESFKEWSAYGAGVPLDLKGSEPVVQYYVPFLSAIQLYIDPSKPSHIFGRHGGESDADSSRETRSDADSSRETSSDDGSECGAERGTNNIQVAWSQRNNMRPMAQSFNPLSGDKGNISDSLGLLVFEYLESDPPTSCELSRVPFVDKIADLASGFPELKTFRSCDLTPASWISVMRYPICRRPTCPTLQNQDAYFLTFHSLSTPFTNSSTHLLHKNVPTARGLQSADMPSKLSLPIFGLAAYMLKVSVWNLDGAHESKKVTSLVRAAGNWLHSLRVNHPDYKFFVSRNIYI
ncbi:hypothetical protein Vadar_014635 [Vaccinium darrowii]|uniref:Uncharacterized protein n=1 Tax=Vaccinium darrowii TaxID=229202 RepID=A0ACB7XS74_9ERIC|nr:hypothetical protein Vadar_014635 [Vaccinium darrowii]